MTLKGSDSFFFYVHEKELKAHWYFRSWIDGLGIKGNVNLYFYIASFTPWKPIMMVLIRLTDLTDILQTQTVLPVEKRRRLESSLGNVNEQYQSCW